MTAVITSHSLGVYHSSLTQTGQAGSGQVGQQGNNVYVNATSGNLVVQQQDELLKSIGIDQNLIRTYNSQGQFNDDNGDNWRLNVHQNINVGSLTGTINTAGSTITKTHGDGSEHTYTYDATSGNYISTNGAGSHDTLSYNAGTDEWTWTDGTSAISETYDGTSGKLLTHTDNDGLVTTYSYTGDLLTSITDGSGQTTDFIYVGNNLTQIRTMSDGVEQTRVRYGYDAENRLSQVTVDLSPEDSDIADNNTFVTTYTYDGTSKRIASITSGDTTSASFTYINDGGTYKVASVTDGEGKITSYNYYASNNQTDITDALGHTTSYRYDVDGQLVEMLSPDTGEGRLSTAYSYDVDGNVSTVTDGNGNIVTYSAITDGVLPGVFGGGNSGASLNYQSPSTKAYRVQGAFSGGVEPRFDGGTIHNTVTDRMPSSNVYGPNSGPQISSELLASRGATSTSVKTADLKQQLEVNNAVQSSNFGVDNFGSTSDVRASFGAGLALDLQSYGLSESAQLSQTLSLFGDEEFSDLGGFVVGESSSYNRGLARRGPNGNGVYGSDQGMGYGELLERSFNIATGLGMMSGGIIAGPLFGAVPFVIGFNSVVKGVTPGQTSGFEIFTKEAFDRPDIGKKVDVATDYYNIANAGRKHLSDLAAGTFKGKEFIYKDIPEYIGSIYYTNKSTQQAKESGLLSPRNTNISEQGHNRLQPAFDTYIPSPEELYDFNALPEHERQIMAREAPELFDSFMSHSEGFRPVTIKP